jgi:thymidylate kinase
MIVTFSGIDGSGKSTRCEAVVRALQARQLPASISRPAYAANDAIKDFCAWAYGDPYAYFNQLDGDFYISCLVADWLAHLVQVLSKSESQILICDRYIYDVLAQAIHMKTAAPTLRKYWALFPTADISYFLDVSAEAAHDRLLSRKVPPIHSAEELGELRILQRAYEDLASDFKWRRLIVSDSINSQNLAEDIERVWQVQRT